MKILLGVAFILVSLFCAVILKGHNPSFALILSVAASAMAVLFILRLVTPYINELHKIFETSSLKHDYFFTVLKGVAICYISRFAADICKDNGQTALSTKAELMGRIGLIALSVPFLKEILDIALSLLV